MKKRERDKELPSSEFTKTDINIPINRENFFKEFLTKVNDFKIDNSYFIKIIKYIDDYILTKSLGIEQQLIELSNAYYSEKLVLVFGAGLSKNFGLPDWNTLLQELILITFQQESHQSYDNANVLAKLYTHFFNPNPLISARFLRNYFIKEEISSFEELVRKILYKNFKKDSLSKSNLLDEILQFCVAPGKSPNLDSIITYNYDDVLETFLSKQKIKIPFRPIFKVGDKPRLDELPIYHVHGFLPQKGKLTESHKITLSEDIYHEQYTNIYSWNNIIQINKFRDNACLFIGVSLTDPNLRRLLDIANTQRGEETPQHFMFKRKFQINELNELLNKYLKENKEIYDEKVMANLKLEDTIKHLVNMKQKFEESDALSFGISIIWIDDYGDIPNILKKIRRRPNK